jgi:uncharacterized protein YprB with RNaseH-like and TPR domain
MIKNSFMILERVGQAKEKSIWQQKINNWDDFLAADKVKGISRRVKKYYDRRLLDAKNRLFSEDSGFFCDNLPLSEHWRLYSYFRENALFIDIESSSVKKGYPTVISLYDGNEVKTLVKGINMERSLLEEELNKAKLLVSFNGSVFDVPFLEKYFRIKVNLPHFDLRFALQRLGYSGSLKDIEKDFGIRRINKNVEELGSGDPFLLWKTFLATCDDYYLNLLVEYNQEDVINLKTIADNIIRRLEWICKN